jgi:hypothetical protein
MDLVAEFLQRVCDERANSATYQAAGWPGGYEPNGCSSNSAGDFGARSEKFDNAFVIWLRFGIRHNPKA